MEFVLEVMGLLSRANDCLNDANRQIFIARTRNNPGKEMRMTYDTREVIETYPGQDKR